MDVISRAMEKKLHLSDKFETKEQTWELFKENIGKKLLFLFGVGEGMNYFFRNCCNCMDITGVVDNDKGIQGQSLGICCSEAGGTKYGELIIEDPDVLRNFCEKNIVVLITSINLYSSMVKQIKNMGIQHCYSLLMLEANRRKYLIGDVDENLTEINNKYIDWCCCQQIKENKIIMLIGVYGSHARQITKALLRESVELDIVWIVNDMYTEKPDGVRLVYMRNWKRYVYEMETSKIWIFDDIIPTQIIKRKTQIYIQVKHWSSITLKKFYLDDKSPVFTADVADEIKCNGSRMDYLFSGSEFDEKSCRSGFMFQGKAIRVGSPRSDVLFDRDIRRKVIEHFGLAEKAKICLYVPTYRLKEYEKNHSMPIILDMESLLSGLKNKWGGEWFLFVRLHPSLVLGKDLLPDSQYIINAGSYPDSEELVAASDIMITDYSSIMFEAAYKKEPVFLYAPDRRKYIGGERDLLIDYNMLPFAKAETNEELYKNIMAFERKEYQKKVEDFLESYGVCEDGHASERAAEFIMNLLGKRELLINNYEG